MGKKAVAGEKIADPAAHADRLGGGPYVLWRERDLWGDLAPHYTTLTRFGQAGGVSWYNNCGPTAVTNLLVMVRRRAGISGTLRGDQDLYARVARYGVRHLFYINARRGPFHGTSDLRAGTYLRRMFRRLAGVSPAITCRRATEAGPWTGAACFTWSSAITPPTGTTIWWATATRRSAARPPGR